MPHRSISAHFKRAAYLFMLGTIAGASFAAQQKQTPKPPFHYVWAKAFYLPPETHKESGYFALCEGKDGKIYVGTAAASRNSHLVEFDPNTEQMRIVHDTHKLLGLPTTDTGYSAQAKIHTRNFVGPSGKIYFGTKQGYKSDEEQEKEKRGEPIPVYKGGYVFVYDPETDKTVNLGMPMPLTDEMIATGKDEGQGVIDVTADESRGLIYVITCEEQHWMLYNMKTKEYRDLGPIANGQPSTLIDSRGRGTLITVDHSIARYSPKTDQVSVEELIVLRKPMREHLDPKADSPDWRVTPDGATAYLQYRNDPSIFRLDLTGDAGQPVVATILGHRIEGQELDSRFGIAIAPDGQVFTVTGVDNMTGFGEHSLHHLGRYDPTSGVMYDLGVLAIKNPEFYYENPRNEPGHILTGTPENPSYYGYETLPDGTLTVRRNCLGTIVASDGTIYITVLYPYTLLRIEPEDYAF